MRFKGEPNLFVRFSSKYVQRTTGKKGFYFDDKGEYETDNEVLIKLLPQYYPVIEEENNDPDEETGEEIKLKHCKKCDFTCETQGQLMSHYRLEHKKEE